MAAALLFFATTFQNVVRAQVQIGSTKLTQWNTAGRLSTEQFDAIKNTTTLFVVQSKDAGRLKDFEKSIAQVWKVTPFRVILPGDMDRYVSDEYSFFTFGGFMVSSSNGGAQLLLTYDLWRPMFKKDGSFKAQELYARIIMSPDGKTKEEVMDGNWSGKEIKGVRSTSEILSTTAHFDNWGAGLIKGYLKIVNDRLLSHKRQGPFSTNEDLSLVSNLSRDTLFIPEYVNDHKDLRTRKVTVSPDDFVPDVADVYPYPVKYVSSVELDDMLVHRTTPFYYLLYIRRNIDKIINIFEGPTGQPVYSDVVFKSLNFKKKDLGRLAREIKKRS